jgi:type I restriction enzyme M protein
MRKRLIEADLVDCVLGLGPGLFYNSPMEACVLFCRTDKAPERKGKVLFINAVDEYARQQAQSFLKSEHIEHIAALHCAYLDQSGVSAVVSAQDILQRDASLSLAVHVPTTPANAELITPAPAVAATEWVNGLSANRARRSEVLAALQGAQV